MNRPVEHKDLLNFHFLNRPSLSPDEARAAYRVSTPDEATNGYRSDLWVCDLTSGLNRRLATGGIESAYCWWHDGSELVFASRSSDAKPGSTIFCSINLFGGERETLFTLAYEVSAIEALDDSRFLITAVFSPEPEDPDGADLMIFEQIPFMANGKGYTGQARVGLGVYDLNTGEFRRLTPPLMDTTRVTLSEDRTRALLVASSYQGLKPLDNNVYELDLASGSLKNLSEGLSFTFKHAVWDRDGKKVVVTATDRRMTGANQNPLFYLLEDGTLTSLSPRLDSSLTNAIVCDSHYGCSELGGAFFPCRAGLLCCSTDGFKGRLCALRPDGLLKQLTTSVSAVVDYSVGKNRAVYVASEGLFLPELYLLEGGQERRLTQFNRPLFETLTLSQPIHVRVDNGEGLKLDGWYMRPVGYREGKKYPAILHIHGGPKASFGDVYHHEMQCWAARGYAVLYCNPRGGDGRGSAFSDIRGAYGRDDYQDLMAFTDWCLKNLTFIDPDRLGVTGGSYGGYMTNWIVTQTDRFKAAVSQRSISNWVSKFGGCDIGYYYVEDQHLGTPWLGMEHLWKESPLKHVDRVRTPILFIHSTEDFRCELNQAFQMFTALKVLGVESRLCVFKGENHELSRSGKPRNRLARLRAILDWFDDHL
ncbi:MAG: S9 family peptidase [Fretibacterium sp.]|nr:S9 family peptidase [Fretibacterium sp.]